MAVTTNSAEDVALEEVGEEVWEVVVVDWSGSSGPSPSASV